MLASADADVVRRDAALRGLALVLDPTAFAAVLREQLAVDAERVEPIYVRYKPATSCLVAYRLVVNGQVIRAYAKAHGGAYDEKLEKRRRLGSTPSWAVIEDPPLALGLFPVDARLRALPLLTDATTRRMLLERLVPAHARASTELSVLAYKPERRFVSQLLVDGIPRAVVKVYTPFDFARAQTAVRAFRTADARVPRRVGHWRRTGMLALEWLEGIRLDEVLRSSGAEDAVARAGAELRSLHRHVPAGLAQGGHDADSRKLEAAAAAVSALSPQLAPELKTVVRRLIDAAPPAAVAVPVHGDFYARQVLLRPDGTVAIVDLDEAEFGDPWSDLATFVAHLECDVVAGQLPLERVEPLRRALLRGYGLDPSVAATAAWDARIAGMLLRLAPRFFRQRDPHWPARTSALIERASELLTEQGVDRRARTFVPAPARTTDTFLPALAHALELDRASQALATLPAIASRTPGRLRSASIVRDKPGRRCVVAYEFEPAMPDAPRLVLLGKMRPQGADWRTYTVQRSLWEQGFGDGSDDGISVPEPIGVVPSLNMWVQRRVAGTSATDRFLSQPDRTLATRVARAIHKLHTSSLAPVRRHVIRDELQILRDRLARVSALRPEWRRRLEHVAKECARLGAAAADAPLAPVHRDFYPDHVLVNGERLYLIDFDLCAFGDPALDAGNFAGHLLELAVRDPGSRNHLEESAAVFSDEFARLAGTPAGARAASYVTLTLARHIYISTQFAARKMYTEQLLDLCEQRLARTPDIRMTAGA